MKNINLPGCGSSGNSKDTADCPAGRRHGFYLPNDDAFTLVEILVVVFIALVLAAIFLPVAKNMIARGESAQCVSQLHQLGVIFTMFENDHGYYVPASFSLTPDMPPVPQSWFQGGTALDVYCGGTANNVSRLAICPTVITSKGMQQSGMSVKGFPYFCNYNIMVVNGGTPVVRLNAMNSRHPSSLVMLLDVSSTNSTAHTGGSGPEDYDSYAGTQHLGNTSILWADNHVTQEVYTNLQAGDFRFILPQPVH